MKIRLLLALSALAFGVAAQAQSTCPSLVITGHPDYPPVAWASQGAIVGAAPDLVAGIARELGVKQVTSKDFGSWEKAQAAAREGRADVIFGIYRTEERAKHLEYLDPPFLVDPVSVVTRAGAGFAYGGWGDLKGRKGVTNAGESFGTRFDEYLAKELTVTRADGVDKAFATLVEGRADYLIVALYPGQKLARSLGLAGKVAFQPKALETADMYVAFSRRSPCGALLGGKFSAALGAAVASGKVQRLVGEADRRFK